MRRANIFGIGRCFGRCIIDGSLRHRVVSGRRLYTRDAALDDEPMILLVSDLRWTPRVDREFLQYLFRNNYEPIEASVGRLPSEVSTCIIPLCNAPLPSLVNITDV